MKDPHTFSVDELRAAGALDVPPGWRKSLGAGPKKPTPYKRDLFSDLIDESDDAPPLKQPETPCGSDDDETTDEVP